jgi:hypothetical protein
MMPKTANEEPSRAKDLSDNADPRTRKSSTERAEPSREKLRREIDAPN